MAPSLASIEDVRLLSATEITKLTNAQLKTALATIIAGYNSNGNADGPTNADIFKELQEIRKDLREVQRLREEVNAFKTQVDELKTENANIYSPVINYCHTV